MVLWFCAIILILAVLVGRWIPTTVGFVSPLHFVVRYVPWPSKWEPAAQAALAAGIVAGLATVGASIFTWVSQTLQVRTESRIRAQFQVLDEIRGYAIKYYIPLMTAGVALSGNLKRAVDNRDLISEQLGFFHFCRFRKLSSVLYRNVSYLFEDISAEEAAMQLDNRIQSNPTGFLTPIDYSNIATLFDADDTFVIFRGKLRRRVWSLIFRKFRRWIRSRNNVVKASVKETITLARAYGRLMAYEMNMVYEVWYGIGRIPELSQETLAAIRRIAPDYRIKG